MSQTRIKRKRSTKNTNSTEKDPKKTSETETTTTTTSPISTSTFPTYAQKKYGEGYTAIDYAYLCKNENFSAGM